MDRRNLWLRPDCVFNRDQGSTCTTVVVHTRGNAYRTQHVHIGPLRNDGSSVLIRNLRVCSAHMMVIGIGASDRTVLTDNSKNRHALLTLTRVIHFYFF